ncbi:MAG: S8 family serine peptidase [Lachnospiraceae bacterium]|nr:S8 family serine peptidase [Candidatus Colinaster scatohippi]
MPKVYINGIVKTTTADDKVVVNTRDENNGGTLDFTDPFLGGNPDAVDEEGNPAPTGVGTRALYSGYFDEVTEPSYFQWFHERINDKFVWYEMNKLAEAKAQGEDYDGPLNPDFNENLENITVAVIDSGFNSKHPDWVGSEDRIVAGKGFNQVGYLLMPDEKPADEDFPELDYEVTSFAPKCKDTDDVIYPAQRPVWKEKKYPAVPANFTQKYKEDNQEATEEDIEDAWIELLDGDDWKTAWEYLWTDDTDDMEGYLNAFYYLLENCESGYAESKDDRLVPYMLAFGVLKDTDWKTAYDMAAKYTYFDDQDGYQCSPSSLGGPGDHGANVSGIIASPANNIGGRGVAAGVKVMPLKVFTASVEPKKGSKGYDDIHENAVYYQLTKALANGVPGISRELIDDYLAGELNTYLYEATEAGILAALNYAIKHSSKYVAEHPDEEGISDQNVRVINMSLGGPVYDDHVELYRILMERARDNGVIVACSAGNENTPAYAYPADSSDFVLNVASLNSDYGRSAFSQYGTGVDIAAPGGDIANRKNGIVFDELVYSTGGADFAGPESDELVYDRITGMHGTSQATPVVAGVTALLWAQYPDMSAEEIREIIISSAKPIKTDKATVNKCVDAAAALGISINTDADFTINTYSQYDEMDVIAVNAGRMSAGSKVVLEHPNEHAVFYYTLDGSEPVVSDDAGTDNSKTYISYDGLLNIEDLYSLSSKKASFTLKAKALLYGVQSKTKAVKIGIYNDVNVLRVKAKLSEKEYSITADDIYGDIVAADICPGLPLTLTAVTGMTDKLYSNVYWSCDDTSVLSVSAAGVVTAKPGTELSVVSEDDKYSYYHRITATDKNDPDNTADFYVKICPKTKEIIVKDIATGTPINAIMLDLNTEGDRLNLRSYIAAVPADASNWYEYKSLNENVLKVTGDGVMTPVAEGVAKVVIRATDGTNIKKEVSVFVGNEFNYTITGQFVLLPGKSATYKAVLPEGVATKDTKIEWYVLPNEVGNNYYCTGDMEYDSVTGENGLVHPDYRQYFTLDANKGIVKVNKDAQNLEAACFTIGVRLPGSKVCLGSRKIYIYPATTKLGLENGKSQITLMRDSRKYWNYVSLLKMMAIEPANAYQKYEVTSSNEKVAAVPTYTDIPGGMTVEEQIEYLGENGYISRYGDGLVLLASGKTTITIKALDGSNKKTSFVLNVLDIAPDEKTVGGLTEKNGRMIIYPGASLQYSITCNNNDNNPNILRPTGYSFDGIGSNYLTVTANGQVKAGASLKNASFTDKKSRETFLNATIDAYHYDNDSGEGEWVEGPVVCGAPIYMYSAGVNKVIPVASDTYEAEVSDRIANYSEIDKNGIIFDEIKDQNNKYNYKYIFAKVEPAGAYGDSFTYKSSNEKVVKVYPNGMVKPVGSGKATITVTAADGTNKSAKINVTVKQPITHIDISTDKGITDVAYGKTLKLKAEVNPDATVKKVTWGIYECTTDGEGNYIPDWEKEITDKNEAVISQAGVLNVKKDASLKTLAVVALANDNNLDEEGRIKVWNYQVINLHPIITAITTEDDYKKVTIATRDVTPGENSSGDEYPVSLDIPLTFAPSEGVYIDKCDVISSNPKAVRTEYIYDEEQETAVLRVTAIGSGKAKATVKALDGSGKSLTIDVNAIIPVSKIRIAGDKNINYVASGKTLQMKSFVNADATNKKVQWEIMNVTVGGSALESDEYDNYVTISPTGKITANKYLKGTKTPITDSYNVEVMAFSTDRVHDGNNLASNAYNITVNKRMESVQIVMPGDVDCFTEGETVKVSARTKEDVCDNRINWYLIECDENEEPKKNEEGNYILLDKKIATISSSGVLKIGKSSANLNLEYTYFYIYVLAADGGANDLKKVCIGGEATSLDCYKGNAKVNEIKVGLEDNMKFTNEQGKEDMHWETVYFYSQNAKGELVKPKYGYICIANVEDDEYIQPSDETSMIKGSKGKVIVEEDDDGMLQVSVIGCRAPEQFNIVVWEKDAQGNASGRNCSISVEVDATLSAGLKYNADGTLAPILEVGDATEYGYTNAKSDVYRFCVWVETDYDTDKDGKADLVKAYLQVPEAAARGCYKAPIVYDPTPYDAGTVKGRLSSDRLLYKYDEIYDENDITEGSRRQAKETVKTAEYALSQDNSQFVYQPGTDGIMIPEKAGYDVDEGLNYYLERGYALVNCSGIGTYGSEGIEMCGTSFERDSHKAVVEWLNGKEGRKAYTDRSGETEIMATDWSNGNVAMIGTSYGGTIPYEVATTGVEGLKTIISSGGIADWYSYTNGQGISVYDKGSYTPWLSEYNGGRYFDRFNGLIENEDTYRRWLGTIDYYEEIANGDYAYTDDDGNVVPIWSRVDYSKDTENINCTAMIVSGINDFNVTSKHADLMYRAFESAGRKATMVLHQGGHISLHGADGDVRNIINGSAFDEILDRWFSYYLLDNEKAAAYVTGLKPVIAQNSDTMAWESYDNWEGYDSSSKRFTGNEVVKLNNYKLNELTKLTESSKVSKNTFGDLDENSKYTGLFAKVHNLAGQEDYSVAYSMKTDSDMIIMGSPVINLKLSPDWNSIIPSAEPDGDSNPDSMSLAGIAEEDELNLEWLVKRGEALDGMKVMAYLIDVCYDEDGELEEFEVTTTDIGSRKKKVPGQIVSFGYLDINNPGGGYYSDDEAYYKAADIEKNGTYNYTMYMKPTYHTLKAGHSLVLVFCQSDLANNTHIYETYELINYDGINRYVASDRFEYSYEIMNSADEEFLELPIAN